MKNLMHTNLCERRPQATVGAHHVVGGATPWPHPATSGSLKVHAFCPCKKFIELINVLPS